MSSKYQKSAKILLSKTRALKVLGFLTTNAIPFARNAAATRQIIAFKKLATCLIREASYDSGKLAKK